MNYNALFIDFNGTLIDSETILYNSWSKVYAIFGIKLNIEYWIRNIRPLRPHAAAYYLLKDNIADPPSPESAQSLQRHFEKEMMDTVQLRPGIRELLEECKRFKIKIAVVSSSQMSWMLPHLGRLGIENEISLLVSSECVHGRVKPDPSCYLYALAKLNYKTDNVIAIEDSPWGIKSASMAGLRAIAYPNKITSQFDLSDADSVVLNPSELLDYLTKPKAIINEYKTK